MFVVDTNILIYGVDKDAPDHARCRELLESFRTLTTPKNTEKVNHETNENHTNPT